MSTYAPQTPRQQCRPAKTVHPKQPAHPEERQNVRAAWPLLRSEAHRGAAGQDLRAAEGDDAQGHQQRHQRPRWRGAQTVVQPRMPQVPSPSAQPEAGGENMTRSSPHKNISHTRVDDQRQTHRCVSLNDAGGGGDAIASTNEPHLAPPTAVARGRPPGDRVDDLRRLTLPSGGVASGL